LHTLEGTAHLNSPACGSNGSARARSSAPSSTITDAAALATAAMLGRAAASAYAKLR
jgi:hypothetical protein